MAGRATVVTGVVTVALAIAGAWLPTWALFLLTVALGKGLAVLGLVFLMRAGLVSFGQGLYYAAGAYTVGFLSDRVGIHDIFVAITAAAIVAVALAALVGLLMVQYREIFFAMLSLAFSMILYGLLVKNEAFGSTDGINVAPPAFAGMTLGLPGLRIALYLVVIAICVVVVYAAHRYVLSPLGYLAHAIKDGEVRVEYLGASVRRAVYAKYLVAAGLAGVSGALVSLAVGHIDPEMAYWTTSGEFVFVAVLGGTGGVLAPLLASVVFEVGRSFASAYSPYTWQLTLGVVMLLVILFLPRGLWSLLEVRGLARQR